MANAVASFWFYFHGDVLRGIFFLGGANLSMMMTLNFIKLIDNIKAVTPMRPNIKNLPEIMHDAGLDYDKEMKLIKQEIQDHKDIAYKTKEKS